MRSIQSVVVAFVFMMAGIALSQPGCGDEPADLGTSGGGTETGDVNPTTGDETSGGDATTEGGTETGEPPGPVSANPYWKMIDLGEDTTWRSVQAVESASGPVYILTGDQGVVAFFDGWETTFKNLGEDVSILDAWVYDFDSMDGLIVDGEKGYVRHLDPAGFWALPSGLPPEGQADFTSVVGNHPDNVYVGGDNGQLWKFKNGDWSSVLNHEGWHPTLSDISAMWMDSVSSHVFIVAENELLSGSSINWLLGTAEKEMKGVHGFASNDVFVVGGFGGGFLGKNVYHFTEVGWVEQSTPAPAAQGLCDVWGTSSADVYAVGFKGTLLHYHDVNGEMEWEYVSAGHPMDLKSPSGTPEETKIKAQDLTLQKIAGRSDEDILVIAEQTIPPVGEVPRDGAGCDGCSCQTCVCETKPECCANEWDANCVTLCVSECEGAGDPLVKSTLLHYTRHLIEEDE
jgi:hypothetical protein